MPPRGRRSTAATQEPEVQEPATNGEADLSGYLDKNLTPTMLDYIEWLTDQVGDLAELDVDRLVALSLYGYPKFQKSDFNRDRKEARREARAAASEPETETEPEPARPARGRGAAKPATPKPAARPSGDGTGRPARPAGRGRGRAGQVTEPY